MNPNRVISKLTGEILTRVFFQCVMRSNVFLTMDDCSYRRNFDLDKENEIHYHSCPWKEHLN